jgi:hypothetical protein
MEDDGLEKGRKRDTQSGVFGDCGLTLNNRGIL